MTGTMKAYVFQEANRAALKQMDIPAICDDEVLVRVMACGVCHTDLMVLTGVNIVPVPFPFISGHEWAGEVVEVGGHVHGFTPGDRVVGEGNSGCGVCRVCQEGTQDYCTVSPVQRGINTDGAMAQYYSVPARLLHKIPDAMDWITASLIEPFTVAYNGIYSFGGCDAGDTVVVQGGGSIGLSALAVAKGMGARTILSEPQAFRRKMGKAMGADLVLDPTEEDPVQVVNSLTEGYGADWVVEASGNLTSMRQSIDLAQNMGRVSYIGVNVGQEIPVKLGMIQMKGLRVQGFLGSPHIWFRAITFLEQSALDISMLSTHQFPIDRVDEAFAFARDIQTNQFIKVTVIME